MVDERSGDRHALLLTAGQFRRQTRRLLGQADEREHLGHLALDRAGRVAGHLERVRDVGVNSAPGQQLVVLEHTPDLTAQVRDLVLVQLGEVARADHQPAFVDLELADEQADEGRLARAAGSDKEYELTRVDRERHVVERADASRVLLCDVIEDHHRTGAGAQHRPTSPAFSRQRGEFRGCRLCPEALCTRVRRGEVAWARRGIRCGNGRSIGRWLTICAAHGDIFLRVRVQ